MISDLSGSSFGGYLLKLISALPRAIDLLSLSKGSNLGEIGLDNFGEAGLDIFILGVSYSG